MKNNKNYKTIIFFDLNNKKKFIMKSTIKIDSEIKIKKNFFPIKKINISSKSNKN